MHYENSYSEFDPYVHDLIRIKARQLIGKAGFTAADKEDIEQELMLDLLQRLKKFDPAKAKRTTFMVRVVNHRIASLIEERQARCRDWRMCLDSLDEPIHRDGDHIVTPADLRPDPNAKTAEQIAFDMDIQAALDAMPTDLREIWDLLLHSNIHRVSKQHGIPRSTIYERVKRLREYLRKAGLGD